MKARWYATEDAVGELAKSHLALPCGVEDADHLVNFIVVRVLLHLGKDGLQFWRSYEPVAIKIEGEEGVVHLFLGIVGAKDALGLPQIEFVNRDISPSPGWSLLRDCYGF